MTQKIIPLRPEIPADNREYIIKTFWLKQYVYVFTFKIIVLF